MATLYGSKIETANPMFADIRAFVSALDGKLTPHRRYGWDKPTFAPPGHHRIQLAASQGDLSAEVATSADLLAGHVYRVRANWAADTGRLILWLEDDPYGTSASEPVEIVSGLRP